MGAKGRTTTKVYVGQTTVFGKRRSIMSIYKPPGSRFYHYEFVFLGKRIRESAKTTSKTVAKEAEKNRAVR
jgi:hypothetical protein